MSGGWRLAFFVLGFLTMCGVGSLCELVFGADPDFILGYYTAILAIWMLQGRVFAEEPRS